MLCIFSLFSFQYNKTEGWLVDSELTRVKQSLKNDTGGVQ